MSAPTTVNQESTLIVVFECADGYHATMPVFWAVEVDRNSRYSYKPICYEGSGAEMRYHEVKPTFALKTDGSLSK